MRLSRLWPMWSGDSYPSIVGKDHEILLHPFGGGRCDTWEEQAVRFSLYDKNIRDLAAMTEFLNGKFKHINSLNRKWQRRHKSNKFRECCIGFGHPLLRISISRICSLYGIFYILEFGNENKKFCRRHSRKIMQSLRIVKFAKLKVGFKQNNGDSLTKARPHYN